MKKSKAAADQPVGIVISTGQTSQTRPKVRAYFWCDVDASDLNRTEDESHLVK